MPGKRSRSGASSAPSLDAAADELYGMPLENFVAARNDLAKAAKAAEDPETAARIGRLAKPNTVAWLANQLSRACQDEVAELLDLGETLRAATAALDAARLRELSAQQRRSTADLLNRAKQLGSSAGQPVSEATARGLENTLHAALADPDAAEQLLAGRLTAGLESSGFPGMALAAAPPVKATGSRKAAQPAPGARRPRDGAADATRRRESERAREEIATAQNEQREAATARKQAQRAADEAHKHAEAATAEVDRLIDELDQAREAQRAADKTARQTARALADAERAARQAAARLDRVSKK